MCTYNLMESCFSFGGTGALKHRYVCIIPPVHTGYVCVLNRVIKGALP